LDDQSKIRLSRLFYDLYDERAKQGPDGDPNEFVLELLNIALTFQNGRPFMELDEELIGELKDKNFYDREKVDAAKAYRICYKVSRNIIQRRSAKEKGLAITNNRSAVDEKGNQYGWKHGEWVSLWNKEHPPIETVSDS